MIIGIHSHAASGIVQISVRTQILSGREAVLVKTCQEAVKTWFREKHVQTFSRPSAQGARSYVNAYIIETLRVMMT